MMTQGLTEEQKRQFDRDGFLIIPGFFSDEQVDRMRNQAQHLLDTFDPAGGHPMTQFSTKEDQHTADEYFLQSSDKISYFFEEGAFQDGKLVNKACQSINKIGHYLHHLDPVFRDITASQRIRDIIESLEYHHPIILQSMLIFKQPRIGGKVAPHQDNSFLYTRPYSTCGFWFPLEDVTEENGCLWFIPGSHKSFPVTRHFARNQAFFDPQSKERKAVQFQYQPEHKDLPDISSCDQYVKACVPKGSAVLIHGSVVHMSLENRSPRSRYTYAFHIIEGNREYPKENWIQIEGGFQHLYNHQDINDARPLPPSFT